MDWYVVEINQFSSLNKLLSKTNHFSWNSLDSQYFFVKSSQNWREKVASNTHQVYKFDPSQHLQSFVLFDSSERHLVRNRFRKPKTGNPLFYDKALWYILCFSSNTIHFNCCIIHKRLFFVFSFLNLSVNEKQMNG